MKYLTLLISLFFTQGVSAQLKFESFNNGIPSNWKVGSGAELSLSNEHFQGGNQSLKWLSKGASEIRVSSLAIPSADAGSLSSGSARFLIYSQKASNDTLIFQFLDKNGSIQREGHMLLNYKGWRDYHRNYKSDYNKGLELPDFELDECRIIFKPEKAGAAKTIWLDEMIFVGNTEKRFPGPHMVMDAEHFSQTASTAGGDSRVHLINWGKGPDLQVSPASEEELAGLQKLRKAYFRSVPGVKPADLVSAKAYVIDSRISRNPDGSIKGRAIESLVNQDTLMMLSAHCGSLARAYLNNKDEDAKSKLILFTEYLLDQGLAEGGRNVITTNTYMEARTFPVGFLEALPVYPAGMRREVIDMLKWSVEYSLIYSPQFIVRLNIDYIHVKSNFLFELAVADPSPEVAVRDLKLVKRFLELNTMIGDGGRDGIKPDGVGMHHQSHHMSYLFSYGTWIERANLLKDTPFRVNLKAYENMRFAVKSLLLETSLGAIYSHSESGRKPFSTVPLRKISVEKLIEIGADILGTPYDPDLAAFYNYIYAEQKYPFPGPDLDGFYQFNYAQLGVLRKNNWVATMRGFTDESFGAEIYKDQNVYGRYQSYGTMEILYDGKLSESGYISQGKGWDWNVIPGTTTVHLPYIKLRPKGNGTRTEFQASAFAGALSLGKEGIFGMDFIQEARSRYPSNNLAFRKSVFAFDDFMVCLGSNISALKSPDSVGTNLFQSITTGSNPAIYVNSTIPIKTPDYASTISCLSQDLWLVNSQTTGYYIPRGNGSVTVSRGAQTTPVYTSFSGKQTETANASKAWINHGTEPKGASYHFVTVPAVTPERMKSMAAKFSNNSLYQVLSQTNSIHAVKYFPKNLTSYVFFGPQTGVNIGLVESITAGALVAIKEGSDTVTVKIANPDLNTSAVPEPTIRWTTNPSSIKLKLKGEWKMAENQPETEVRTTVGFTELTFNLNQGFPSEIKLLKALIP